MVVVLCTEDFVPNFSIFIHILFIKPAPMLMWNLILSPTWLNKIRNLQQNVTDHCRWCASGWGSIDEKLSCFKLRWFVFNMNGFILPAYVDKFCVSHLTHWGRGKIAAISQTTFSNAFYWMKMYEFRLIFQWNLFQRFQLSISQHWCR